MTTSTWFGPLALLSACALTACGDDSSGGTAGSGGSGSTATSGATTATTASGSGGDASAGSGGGGDGGGTATASTTSAVTTGGQGGGGDGGAGAGGGGFPDAEVPDVSAIVEQVAAEHPDLLQTNTYESCGELVQRVLMVLAADDPEWGHVAKTAGESQYTPPGFEPRDVDGHLVTGFSQDAIFHRATYWQVDIIANAAANSDPDPSIHGPASITWQVIEREHYRENNPWMAPVPLP